MHLFSSLESLRKPTTNRQQVIVNTTSKNKFESKQLHIKLTSQTRRKDQSLNVKSARQSKHKTYLGSDDRKSSQSITSNSIKRVKNVTSNRASLIKDHKICYKNEEVLNLHNVPKKSVSLASLGSLSQGNNTH